MLNNALGPTSVAATVAPWLNRELQARAKSLGTTVLTVGQSQLVTAAQQANETLPVPDPLALLWGISYIAVLDIPEGATTAVDPCCIDDALNDPARHELRLYVGRPGSPLEQVRCDTSSDWPEAIAEAIAEHEIFSVLRGPLRDELIAKIRGKIAGTDRVEQIMHQAFRPPTGTEWAFLDIAASQVVNWTLSSTLRVRACLAGPGETASGYGIVGLDS